MATITDLSGTRWYLNANITNTVPDGSDFQSLHFNFYCSATTSDVSDNMCAPVIAGVCSSFSTWQELIVQLPSLLERINATNVSSTLDATSIPNNWETELYGRECQFISDENEGHYFTPNGGFNIVDFPNILGTISFTYEEETYSLTFLELSDWFVDHLGFPLFDTGIIIYGLEAGFSFEGLRTWFITGGTDATNSDLIAWLQSNATQIITGHTLTYSGDLSSYLDVKVNNISVSSGTTINNGDKVEVYLDNIYPNYELLVNDKEITDNTIRVINEDISIEVNEVVSYDPVFSNNAPQQLAAAFDSGNIPATWNVGDYIDITLTNGNTARVMLVHKTSATSNYKYNNDDTTCPFILSVMNFVGRNNKMNSSQTNVGGWNGSRMRTYVNSSAFLGLFPSDWKSCLAMLKVKAMNGGSHSGTTLVESADKMFLFAEKEYYGAVQYSSATEGNALNQLDYYANLGVSLFNYSALRKDATPTTTSYSYYWERSTCASDTSNFCLVYSGGNAVFDNANRTSGVIVGFSLSLTHTS